MPGGTTSADRFDEFRDLHAQGYGRNRIAREMGIAPVVASRTAEHLGLTFDRSKIQAATEARLADLAERRSILAEDLIGDAEKLRAQMWQPAVIFSFGGKDNTYAEEHVSEPPSADKRALMSTAGMAIDRSLKLAPAEESSNLDSAKSMLGSLGDALVAFSRAEDEREDGQSSDGAGEA
ncbi:hypothetical protein [Streptomyces sp. NBC_01483]|uniref:hypothetical protein n=1 Tax=Streptomyces sp. NBC_01483 TaxID=2903883 RepID=UPI002E32E4D2|nr:hypothetical protein [Streptomyces sp. NBC_01483]